MQWLGWLLVVALLPSTGAFAAPAVGTPEVRPDHTTASNDPANTPIDTLWQRVLQRGDAAGVRNTYELTAMLYQGRWRVSAVGCDAHAKEIAEALQVNPVSFAVWSMATDCAAAVGDNALEAQRRRSLQALMQQAVAALPPENGALEQLPIRILQESDAFAFAHVSGEAVLLAHYEFPDARHMPLALVLWDPSSLRERTLWFDFMEPVLQLTHDAEAKFPDYRRKIGQQTLRELEDHGLAASWATELLDVPGIETPEGVQAFIELAQHGNFNAAAVLADECLKPASTRACATAAVAQLRPWVAQGSTIAKLMLARAYADGVGIGVDKAMARKLISEVDARRGDRSGTLEFDTMRLQRNGDRIDPLVREDVLALARAQDPLAETLVANEVRVSDDTLIFTGPVMVGLRHAAAAGLPSAESLLGRALLAMGKDDEGIQWLEKAAEHDDGLAQGWLGDIYDDATNGQARDIGRARHWRERVSLIGTYTQPMEQMGYDYWWNAAPTPENRHLAQRWLQNAAARDDEPGARWLAHLYEEGGPGVDGGESEAIDLYRWLVARQPRAADARWYLANLLGKGSDAASHKAEIDRLLTEAEQQGDGDSQRWLASALVKGTYRPSDPEVGAVWYRRAIAQGNDGARGDYAWMLLDGIGVERDIPAARTQWEAAIAHGQQSARDDMAWALCTHPDSRIREPYEGLRLATKLDQDNAAHMDTLAACQAAVGSFDQAIETEKKAIEIIVRRKTADNTEKYDARLAQYQRGERYTMDEPVMQTRIRNAEEARRRRQLR